MLIGADFYISNTIPDAPTYRSLGRCVRDVTLVEDYLMSRLGVSPENILKLTATCESSSYDVSSANIAGPVETQEKWPTYDNIVAAFNRIFESASPGDHVYIHYSGHGSCSDFDAHEMDLKD